MWRSGVSAKGNSEKRKKQRKAKNNANNAMRSPLVEVGKKKSGGWKAYQLNKKLKKLLYYSQISFKKFQKFTTYFLKAVFMTQPAFYFNFKAINVQAREHFTFTYKLEKNKREESVCVDDIK
ncbi:unnamed protein product [Meloidogyne enterolobii]|uniref:Uncharacterized protein n=1 Tax=Meloidogyne enterolobii TaxID=390850 RepID=A0ACB0XQN6_MELEN